MPGKNDDGRDAVEGATKPDLPGNSSGPGPGKPMKDKLTLVFVINGEEVPLEVEPHAPLGSARNQALAKSHNTGRPPEEWEIRSENGEKLSPDRKVMDFGFADGVILFLTLRVAAGGR